MNEKLTENLETTGTTRVLLVQSCDLPQWFYTCEQLKRLHPDWTIDGLGIDLPDVRFFVDYLSQFDRIWYHPTDLADVDGHDLVIFPLMNRGYLKIKVSGWKLEGKKLWVDYNGCLSALRYKTLLRSALTPCCPPTDGFVEYLEEFPHRPLGEKTLLVESCHPSLIEKTAEDLEKLLPSSADITRISGGSLWNNWRHLRDKSFDGAVVYFSSEKGFFGLKLIPFLLRVPKILVFNENGNYFYSSPKQLLRFLFTRFRHGAHFSHDSPRILLFQTEACPYLEGAVERLLTPGLFPKARISVVCCEEDAPRLRDLEGVVNVITFGSKDGLGKVLELRRAFRTLNPDINCAVFTGCPVFRKQKLAFFLMGARRCFAFNARLDGYWLSLRTLRHTRSREPLLFGLEKERPRKFVFVQTEAAGYTREAIKRLRDEKLFPYAEILLICRREDRETFRSTPGVEHVLTFGRGNRLAQAWRLLRQVRRFQPSIKAAVFSGRPVFRAAKLLYLLIPCRLHLIFNAGLDGYWLSPKTLPRMFQREPLLPGFVDEIQGSHVLLFQTEALPYLRATVERIRDPRLYPSSKIVVVCRENDREEIERIPGISQVLTFAPRASLTASWKLLRKLRRFKAEAKVGVFSGRPVFRGAKALFWLSKARRRFAFNAQLDGYWLGLSSIPRTFRKEPLLFNLHHRESHHVLLLETESELLMTAAAEIVQQPHVVPRAKVTVFCREDRVDAYQRVPGVDRCVPYSQTRLTRNVVTVVRLARLRPEVVAAIFSGRRIFLKQKLLFWLLPAGSRLAFNEALDCFYVNRKTFAQFMGSRAARSTSTLELLGRGLCKGLLFIPRFTFLLGWTAYMNLRYRRSSR